jgi:hypothetical protein
VRSASVVLPAEADWVGGAMSRLVIRAGQRLVLA